MSSLRVPLKLALNIILHFPFSPFLLFIIMNLVSLLVNYVVHFPSHSKLRKYAQRDTSVSLSECTLVSHYQVQGNLEDHLEMCSVSGRSRIGKLLIASHSRLDIQL